MILKLCSYKEYLISLTFLHLWRLRDYEILNSLIFSMCCVTQTDTAAAPRADQYLRNSNQNVDMDFTVRRNNQTDTEGSDFLMHEKAGSGHRRSKVSQQGLLQGRKGKRTRTLDPPTGRRIAESSKKMIRLSILAAWGSISALTSMAPTQPKLTSTTTLTPNNSLFEVF